MENVKQNKAIVEEGLQKRKTARQAQEQAHEDMRRAMFETISNHHDDVRKQRDLEDEQRARDMQKAIEKAARESVKQDALKELAECVGKRKKGLKRTCLALLAGVTANVLLRYDGISFWVAAAVVAIVTVIALVEIVKAIIWFPSYLAAWRKVDEFVEG